MRYDGPCSTPAGVFCAERVPGPPFYPPSYHRASELCAVRNTRPSLDIDLTNELTLNANMPTNQSTTRDPARAPHVKIVAAPFFKIFARVEPWPDSAGVGRQPFPLVPLPPPRDRLAARRPRMFLPRQLGENLLERAINLAASSCPIWSPARPPKN